MSRQGNIPQSFIDDLIARADIVELVESRIPLKSAGHNAKGLCPFHQEKSPSFTVSATKQFYYCFGCHASGNVIGFLMAYDRLSFIEAVEYLAKDQGVNLPKEYIPHAQEKINPDYYALLTQVMRFYCTQLKRHAHSERAIDYLKNRGLTGEVCQRFAIGYAPSEWDGLATQFGKAQKNALLETGMLIEKNNAYYDRFRDRIMFPIRDKRGRVLGFGGRILDSGEPKYLNSPETLLFHKGSELYGLYEAIEAQRDFKYIIVVEGYMDVVALAQYGINSVVATMGTALTEKQLSRLFRLCDEVVLCFDGDSAGQQAAWRALETSLPLLTDDRALKFIFLPERDDPDSFVRKIGAEGFKQTVKDATPFAKFFIKHLLDQVDSSHVGGQARLINLSGPLLAKLPKGVLREMLIEQLVQYTRLDRARLLQVIFPEQKQAVVVRPRATKTQALSALDQAICLLLHQGQLAELVDDVNAFATLPEARVQLFVELVQLLKANPQLNMGALIAHWSDEAIQQDLAALAARPLLLAEQDAIKREFSDIVDKLCKELTQQQLGHLLTKIRRNDLSELTAADRAKVQQLLRKDEEA